MKSSRGEPLFTRPPLPVPLSPRRSSLSSLVEAHRAADWLAGWLAASAPGLDSVSFVYSTYPLLFNFIVPRVTASQATKPYYEFHASRVKGRVELGRVELGWVGSYRPPTPELVSSGRSCFSRRPVYVSSSPRGSLFTEPREKEKNRPAARRQ